MHFIKFLKQTNTAFLISLLISLNILTGCNDPAPQDKQMTGKLIIGTSADNPPFEFFKTSEGGQTIEGFDVELGQALGEILNRPVEFRDMDLSSLLPALQSGRIHMVMAEMTPSAERAKNFDFSNAYTDFPVAFIVKPGTSLNKAADLQGQSLGVQLGTFHEKTLQEIAQDVPNIRILSLNRVGVLVQELRSGRVSGVLSGHAIAKAYAEANPDLTYELFSGHTSKSAIVLKKNSPLTAEINQALDQLHQNGKLQELHQKWFKM